MSTLGERLREERERLGMSQPAFAAIAGTTKQTLFSWESGKTAPDAHQLAAIQAAGADVLYILTGQRTGAVAPTPALKPEEAALLDNYRHASPEGKKAIKATSDALAKPSSGNGGKKSA